jgi:hypothetical protein
MYKMQIFVRTFSPSKTLVFPCSEKTTLEEFLQWVEDKTGIPEQYYFILHGGRYMYKYSDQQKACTFAQMGITNETTLHLNARFHVKAEPQKLNAAA